MQRILVIEDDRSVRKALKRLLEPHGYRLFESLKPIPNRVRWNCECCCFDLTCPANSASHSRPRKKCQDCSGRATPVAEIKMVRSGIIKIHRALDETQTEKANVKIQIPLRIARDRSDVMKAWNFAAHQGDDNIRFNGRGKSGGETGIRLGPTASLRCESAFVLKGQL